MYKTIEHKGFTDKRRSQQIDSHKGRLSLSSALQRPFLPAGIFAAISQVSAWPGPFGPIIYNTFATPCF